MQERVTAPPPVEGSPTPPSQERFSSKIFRWLGRLIRELVALFLWLYVITKLFVYDLDVYVVDHYAPGARWIIDFKFFIIIGIWAACFILFRRNRILLWSTYVIFYPLVILLW